MMRIHKTAPAATAAGSAFGAENSEMELCQSWEPTRFRGVTADPGRYRRAQDKMHANVFVIQGPPFSTVDSELHHTVQHAVIVIRVRKLQPERWQIGIHRGTQLDAAEKATRAAGPSCCRRSAFFANKDEVRVGPKLGGNGSPLPRGDNEVVGVPAR